MDINNMHFVFDGFTFEFNKIDDCQTDEDDNGVYGYARFYFIDGGELSFICDIYDFYCTILRLKHIPDKDKKYPIYYKKDKSCYSFVVEIENIEYEYYKFTHDEFEVFIKIIGIIADSFCK